MDGQMDRGATDGHRDWSDFIGCCPTNVERPTVKMFLRQHEIFHDIINERYAKTGIR